MLLTQQNVECDDIYNLYTLFKLTLLNTYHIYNILYQCKWDPIYKPNSVIIPAYAF